ncbi:RNA-binding domain-containing protein [Corynebacterium kozikiae]|uniref:RNA-binding domain-containing protein n=1 Tax=Corynebacterium kozikiae TaxID=2968469 RepID=UPI00211BBFBC|nr:RNA-binding domain-containing protein [Corynebacterium sp. 76QC2CO]MCQ9342619.1 putative DNA binding domain-containing protein [Corynebacterium sp. 76QC2CO]
MSTSPLLQEMANANLPKELCRALVAIVEHNETPDSQESQTLDFKEDPVTTTSKGSNPDAKLIDIILKAVVCMANGNDEDSFVVLGVRDQARGEEALMGTEREPDWLRRKIFNGTTPELDVHIEPFIVRGKRLLIIRIPRPLRVYSRKKGESWYREGTDCIVMSQEKRNRLDWERRNPDYTASPADIEETDLDGDAIGRARRLLTEKHFTIGETEAPTTNHGLIRELGLLDNNEKLLRAGQILLGPSPSNRVVIRHLYSLTPGAEPQVQELTSPLIKLFSDVKTLIDAHSSQEIARVDLGGGQETPIPAFPRRAVDEVVSNAMLHRDWLAVSPIVIKQTPRTLTVISPGGLPPSVTEANLLTTRSVPRNPALMDAARRLGLAEESSRGFDRMWVSMLASGRRAPVVKVGEFEVSVTLDAGSPDLSFIQGLAAMAETIEVDIRKSVTALIIVRFLVDNPGMTWHEISENLQTNELETWENIDWLLDMGVIQKTGERFNEWRLTDRCRELFNVSNSAPTASEAELWIQQQLQEGEALTTREIADQLKVPAPLVTKLLRGLRTQGVAMIDPEGPQRGSNTRWISRPR